MGQESALPGWGNDDRIAKSAKNYQPINHVGNRGIIGADQRRGDQVNAGCHIFRLIPVTHPRNEGAETECCIAAQLSCSLKNTNFGE